MKKKTPNMASVTRRATTFAPAKVELRKSERSSIGERWCSSSRTKAASETAERTKRPMITGSVQPYEFASISAKVSAKSPTPEASRPGMSSRCSAEVSRDSLITSRPTIRPRTPMGTLTKKIQLQSMCSVMSPPMSGPIASAIAETPAQMPIAIPRWCGGKVAEMIESVAGSISAAPTPCTVRAPISISPARGEAAGERRER